MRLFSGVLGSIFGALSTSKKEDANAARRQIGDHTYGDPEILSWGEGADLSIGRFCSIAPGVKIFLGGEHRTDWVTTFPFSALFEEAKGFPGHPASKGDVVIGHDVWIGEGAVILSGVTIGNGAVIGARSVVAKDVPAYGVAIGNPARIVRYRFDDETIAKLLHIAWWDWPIAKIQAAWPLMLSSDIKAFVDAYGDAGGARLG